MAFLIVCFIVTLIIISIAAESELRLVQLVWRHGNRNVELTYPNDPYKDPSFWPDGFGELTNLGVAQHEELGRFLRRRYDGFIKPHFDPKEVHLMSSAVNRTISSAFANLKGFFNLVWTHRPQIKGGLEPLKNTPDEDGKLQLPFRIPLTLIPKEKDNKIFQMAVPCPKWSKLFKNALATDPAILKIKSENQWMFDYLTLHTGQAVDDFHKICVIYDILNIESSKNFTLPPWTKRIYPNPTFEFLQSYSFKTATFSPQMKRLRGGPLFKDILTHMTHNAEGKSGAKYKKLFLYSGHDITISSLLDLMGVFDIIRPPYAAAVIFELRKDIPSGSFFVDVLYRNDSSREPYKLHPEGCPQSSCDLSTFTKVFKHLIPGNWFKECKL